MGKGSHSVHALVLGTQLHKNIEAYLMVYFHTDKWVSFLPLLLPFFFSQWSQCRCQRSQDRQDGGGEMGREHQCTINWHCCKKCLKIGKAPAFKVIKSDSTKCIQLILVSLSPDLTELWSQYNSYQKTLQRWKLYALQDYFYKLGTESQGCP